jgi:hypothetical protein
MAERKKIASGIHQRTGKPNGNGKPNGTGIRSRNRMEGLPKGSTVIHPETKIKREAAKLAASQTPVGKLQALGTEMRAQIREMQAKLGQLEATINPTPVRVPELQRRNRFVGSGNNKTKQTTPRLPRGITQV